MRISKENKKAEAINRMKMLGLSKSCIKAFQDRDEVQLSETNGELTELSKNEELRTYIENLEKTDKILIYHVLHTNTPFGEMYSFLLVSDYGEEWESDRRNVKNNRLLSYVWNKDVPEYSEYGYIVVTQRSGGLTRLY